MAAKMSPEEVREFIKEMGWTTDEEAAVGVSKSLKTIYNWKRKGCPHREGKRLRKMLKDAQERLSA